MCNFESSFWRLFENCFKEICLMYLSAHLLRKKINCVSVLRWLEQQTSRHQTLTKSCIFRHCQEWGGDRWLSQFCLLASFLLVKLFPQLVIQGTCYTITVHGLSEFALYAQFSYMVNKIRHSLEGNITLLSISWCLFGLALKCLT